MLQQGAGGYIWTGQGKADTVSPLHLQHDFIAAIPPHQIRSSHNLAGCR